MKKHGQPDNPIELTEGRKTLYDQFRRGIAGKPEQSLMANWLRDLHTYHKLPPVLVESDMTHQLLMKGAITNAEQQYSVTVWVDRLRLGNLTALEKTLIMDTAAHNLPAYELTPERILFLESLSSGIIGPKGQQIVAAWIADLHAFLETDPRAYLSDPLYRMLRAGEANHIESMHRIAAWTKRLVEDASKKASLANPVPTPEPSPRTSANDRQVGGDHYRTQGGIQHWDLAVAYELPYLAGQATKYVARARKKNGRQDLEKAMHFLEKLIETEESANLEGAPALPDISEFGKQQGLTYDETMILSLVIMFERTGQPDLLHMAKAGLARLLEQPAATVR